MITAPGTDQLPRPVLPAGPPDAPAQGGGRAPQLCTRCGAVGTHYLTCTSLRLPEGYRLGEETRPGCPCGLAGGTCRMCA